MISPISKILALKSGGKGLVSLMYHSIKSGSDIPDWPWAVSYRAFCEQMDLLRTLGWQTICARELETSPILPARTVCITFDDGYADNYKAFTALRERGMRASWFIVSRDVGRMSSWPGETIPPQPILSVEQLREMEGAGMEICSHTVSHSRLTETDDATVQKELSDSRKQLSDMLGHDITTFAYPYGLFNDHVVEATRQAGYRVAFTTVSGFGVIDDDLFRVRRITIFGTDNMSTFSRKLFLGRKDVRWRTIAQLGKERGWKRFLSLIRSCGCMIFEARKVKNQLSG
jgi:peptidoglycan/xylan/chitin deacetylase (PgdA/CDA1 family)